MKITVVSDSLANLELSNKEIKTIERVFVEVKSVLDYEPEFETRVGGYYTETQEIITSLSNNSFVSLKEITIINSILNEVCNGIKIKNFDAKIGVSKSEAESYLIAINKVMNELRKQSEK